MGNPRCVKDLPSTLPLSRHAYACLRLGLMNGCVLFDGNEILPASVNSGQPIMRQSIPSQLMLRAEHAPWTLSPEHLPQLPRDYDRAGLVLLAPSSN